MLGAWLWIVAACAVGQGVPPQAAPEPWRYQTKPVMPGRYEGEERGLVWGTKVVYLDRDQRLAFLLAAKDGRFWSASGEAFSSTDKAGAIFIMDGEGRFYASNQREPGEFHHSSFLAGGAVAAAGELVIEEGVLKKVTDVSGHYEPEHLFTQQALCEMRRQEIDLTAVVLKLVTFGELNAGEYVAGHPCPF